MFTTYIYVHSLDITDKDVWVDLKLHGNTKRDDGKVNKMEKKYQIFISSTYEDLKEERRKVQDTILEMYHFPIGMEMFSADDEEQWEIIQETIDSSDYYVLIIGHRYGSVIKEGEYEGISYTQKEFRYALEKKIPILAFLIADNVAVIPDKMEDEVDKKDKLKAFKDEVTTGRTVQWWTSSEDLANKVSISLNKKISKGKRPGWIRAEELDIDGTQKELVEMSKKIRKLEEENEELRRKIVIRKPELQLKINGNKKIEIPYIEYNTNSIDCDYMELSMDDVPNEAKGSITTEMLNNYNTSLPSNDILETFKKEWRFYKQAKENPVEVNFTVCNHGNVKAKDIYLEIQFPDEVMIYKKNSEIFAPEWPNKGKNPIDEYYKNSPCPRNASVVKTILFPRGGKLLDTDYIGQMDSPYKHFYNDDNSLSIRMEDLMTGYTWSIREKYILVPKEKGIFKIVCSFMCEEYDKRVEQFIQVVVE